MPKLLILIILFLFSVFAWGQDSATGRNLDSSIQQVQDSVNSRVIPDSLLYSRRDPIEMVRYARGVSGQLISWNHPYFRFTQPIRYAVTPKKWNGKETIFYTIVGLLLFFAILRNSFQRYVQDLFRTYFRTTVKQRQIREQLLQSPLPSLLFNLFFLVSLGLFLALLLQYFGLGTQINFWLLFLYCFLGLAGIYGIKYITLKILGWLFQAPDATESYIFVVFTTNKVLGMMLIPFIVVLAFSFGNTKQIAITLSLIVVGGLLVYRFFLSYSSIRGKIRISFFHFFIYLLAFEIIPLLLINKLLFRYLGETP